MDEKLRQLLDQMPERPPRSKLEPHRDVIRALRQKRRTYEEIAAFFREHLQLSVAPSTIHEFVKTRARQARQQPAERPELPAALSPSPSPAHMPLTREATVPSPTQEAGRERMRAIRSQPPPAASVEPPRFQYDPEDPLTLHPSLKEK